MKNRDGGIEVKGGQRLVLKAAIVFATVFAFFAAFSSIPSFAGGSDVGTSGAQFLKIGVGRAEAMGGAYAAFADDATSLYWNPAGLARVRSPEVYASHNQFLEDLRYNYVGFARPLSKSSAAKTPGSLGAQGAVGISLQLLTQTSIPKLDNTGTEVGSFSPTDMAVSLGYGQSLSSHVTAGGSVKWIRQKIDDFTATAYALDLGAQARYKDFSAGAVLANLGSKIKFRSQSDPLPLNLRLGLGYNPLDKPWRVALEGNFPRDNDPDARVGGEYLVSMERVQLALRAGFRSTVVSELGTGAGFSAGLGFAFRRLGVDLAFAPYGDLGQSYQIGLNYKF